MFDIGGWEFFLVLLLALIVIGPKDLPGAIRTVTQWIRRARGLAREFQSGLDDLASEADLDKVKSDLMSDTGLDDIKNEIHGSVKDYVDPDDDIKSAFDESDFDEYDELGDDDPFVTDEPQIADTTGSDDVIADVDDLPAEPKKKTEKKPDPEA